VNSNDKLQPLIQLSIAKAVTTSGPTRNLWLMLFRLLCQWWIE
jgi:hypothetical protein